MTIDLQLQELFKDFKFKMEIGSAENYHTLYVSESERREAWPLVEQMLVAAGAVKMVD